jgi:hypothetical protein
VTYTSNILSEERYLLKPLHHFISVLFCAVLWFICPNIFSSPIILTCKFLRHLTVSSFAALFGNRSGASLRFLFPFPYSQLVCLLISSSMSKKTTIESFTQDSPTKKRKITHLQKHIYSTPSSGNNDKKTHNKSSLLYLSNVLTQAQWCRKQMLQNILVWTKQQLQQEFQPDNLILDSRVLIPRFGQERCSRDLCDDGTGHCTFASPASMDYGSACNGDCPCCFGQKCPFCDRYLALRHIELLKKQGGPPLPQDGCPEKFLPSPVGKIHGNVQVYIRDVRQYGILPDTPLRKTEKECQTAMVDVTSVTAGHDTNCDKEMVPINNQKPQYANMLTLACRANK